MNHPGAAPEVEARLKARGTPTAVPVEPEEAFRPGPLLAERLTLASLGIDKFSAQLESPAAGSDCGVAGSDGGVRTANLFNLSTIEERDVEPNEVAKCSLSQEVDPSNVQARVHVVRSLVDCVEAMSTEKKKQHWAKEKPKLDNAKKNSIAGAGRDLHAHRRSCKK